MKGVERTAGATHEPCTVLLFRTSREDNLLRRARGEYREMPGLRLTIDQAMRLWDLDRETCRWTFDALVSSGFLVIGNDGRYRKAHHG